MLCAYINLENFNAATFAKTRKKRGRILKLDARNHKVLYNDNGECSVEQFGSLPIAVAKYKEIIELCMK